MLNRIPGVLVNGNLEGGYQISDWLVGSTITPQVPSINGALAYETSTTLDGMMLVDTTTIQSPGAGFDLAGLPLSAFDTADVVRGPGANSPSIVDSVGGSLVLHAPGPFQKNSAEFSISNDPWGGVVANSKINYHIGKKLAVMVSYGINDSPGIFGDNKQTIPLGQMPATINGHAFAGCVAGQNNPYNCEATFPCPTNYYYNYCGFQGSLLYCCVPFSSAHSQHNGAASLTYDISPKVSAQIFYAGTDSRLNDDPFGTWGMNFVPGPGYSAGIAPGMHRYLELNPYYLYQSSSLLEEKLTAYLGQGVLRLAAVQNNSGSFANHIFPNCVPNGQYTVYGTGYYADAPNTQQTFNGTQANLTFPPIYLVEDFSDKNRDILASYATQVGTKTHAGVSFTQSYYNSTDWIPYNGGFGQIVFDQMQSGNSETTREYRFNVGTDVSDKFSVDASWYMAHADYHTQNPESNTGAPWQDDIFTYSAPRVGLTWRANPDMVFRASAGGGFALPQIGNLSGQLSGLPSCNGAICSVSGANLNLRPEKSFGFDIGTDIRLHSNDTLSFDLYRNNLFGQFFTATLPAGTYSGTGCQTPPCLLYTTQYQNLGHSVYEGINATLRHDPARGVYWQGSIGFLRAFLVSIPAGFYDNPAVGCTNCTNQWLLPNVNFNGATQSGVSPTPYAQGSGTIGYRWAPEKYVDLAPTYYGNGNAYFEPAFVKWDAHMSLPLTRNVTLFTTFQNLLNTYPDSFVYVVPSSVNGPGIPGTPPYANIGIPLGPRAAVVTLQFRT